MIKFNTWKTLISFLLRSCSWTATSDQGHPDEAAGEQDDGEEEEGDIEEVVLEPVQAVRGAYHPKVACKDKLSTFQGHEELEN